MLRHFPVVRPGRTVSPLILPIRRPAPKQTQAHWPQSASLATMRANTSLIHMAPALLLIIGIGCNYRYLSTVGTKKNTRRWGARPASIYAALYFTV